MKPSSQKAEIFFANGLEDLNIVGRHIIRITGHKSVNSVQNYARRLSASRKRNISASFANHLSVSSDSGPSCSKLRKHNEPVVEKENCVTTASKNIVDFEIHAFLFIKMVFFRFNMDILNYWANIILMYS